MKINSQVFLLISISKRENEINTNPDYQRSGGWTIEKDQPLIDTILQDYDIPKIYLTNSSGMLIV